MGKGTSSALLLRWGCRAACACRKYRWRGTTLHNAGARWGWGGVAGEYRGLAPVWQLLQRHAAAAPAGTGGTMLAAGTVHPLLLAIPPSTPAVAPQGGSHLFVSDRLK